MKGFDNLLLTHPVREILQQAQIEASHEEPASWVRVKHLVIATSKIIVKYAHKDILA